MGPLLLAALAHGAPGVTLETVSQIRHDYWGETLIPAWQTLAFQEDVRQWHLTGYAGLDWGQGLDTPVDPDLYSLEARASLPWGGLAVGRMVATSALRPQTLDGAFVSWKVADRWKAESWAGYARHQDLDDLADGAALGRVQLLFHQASLQARAGAEVEAGPGTPGIAREDAEFRWAGGTLPGWPTVAGRAVVAQAFRTPGAPTTLEWARLEVGGHLVPAFSTSLYGQHREAADPRSLLGDALIEALAGGAVEEVGVQGRLYSRRWAMASASWGLASYTVQDVPMYGHSVQASYVTGATQAPFRLVPSYVFRSGPGGAYHAAIVSGEWAVSDRFRLDPHVAAVPYRKGHAPWDLALDGGVDGTVRLARWVRVGTNLDLATDGTWVLDFRGGMVLTLETGP